MNPALKQSWLAALRSGEYKQGCGALRTATGYCCLGVLCDVIDPEKWVKCQGVFNYNNQDVYAFGLEGVPGDADQRRLGGMNDKGQSFLQIADYIEANL